MTKWILDGGAELISHPSLQFLVGAGVAGGLVRCDSHVLETVRRRTWDQWRHKRPTSAEWVQIVATELIAEQLRSRSGGA